LELAILPLIAEGTRGPANGNTLSRAQCRLCTAELLDDELEIVSHRLSSPSYHRLA